MVEHDETTNDKAANDEATANSEKMSTDMAGSGMTPDDAKNTTATGSDLPRGDGMTSDEGFHRIAGTERKMPTGVDHSTEGREDQMPTSGVGAFESSSQPLTSTIAHIDDEGEK